MQLGASSSKPGTPQPGPRPKEAINKRSNNAFAPWTWVKVRGQNNQGLGAAPRPSSGADWGEGLRARGSATEQDRLATGSAADDALRRVLRRSPLWVCRGVWAAPLPLRGLTRPAAATPREPNRCYSYGMRILVTGGAGVIGSHLVVRLLQAGAGSTGWPRARRPRSPGARLPRPRPLAGVTCTTSRSSWSRPTRRIGCRPA